MHNSIGIVGATGAVGQALLQLMELRSFPVQELRLFASERSTGKRTPFRGQDYTLEVPSKAAFQGLRYVFFCTDTETTQRWLPEALDAGCTVIDNSALYRSQVDVPLIVPEINGDLLKAKPKLIANPNCSTAIALMGLFPLHQAFGLKRFIASTYQAVSGSGQAGIEELQNQITAFVKKDQPKPMLYERPIAFNLIPKIDTLTENGYTKEELKMKDESRKILNIPHLLVSTSCVRVPTWRAHSIAVHAEFEQPIDLAKAETQLKAFPGLQFHGTPDYPTPLDASENLSCHLGRLRKDSAFENGLAFWMVGDQVWKGAALNALQIAERLEKELA